MPPPVVTQSKKPWFVAIIRPLFFAIPLACATIITANYILSSPRLALFPVAFASAAFAFGFIATGRWRNATLFTATFVIALHLADRLKIHYYKEPILAADLRIIADGENWDVFRHYPESALATLGLIVLLLAPLFLRTGEPRRGRRPQAAVALASLSLCGAGAVLTRSTAQYEAWLKTLPKGRNVPANLAFSAAGMRFTPPKFPGDARRFAALVAAERFVETPPAVLPDIVLMLQESTVAPALYGESAAKAFPLRMFSPEATAGRIAPMRVHTYGGGTWRTEFDVLTGLSCNDFGAHTNSVFYTVAPHVRTALPAFLKKAGYHTVVISPFNKNAYHAAAAYRSFGFDEVIQPQDLGYPAEPGKNLWHIESGDMAACVTKVLARKSDKPRLVYLLTMKEHGPYDAARAPYPGLDPDLPRDVIGKLSDYLNRLPALDHATIGLKQELDRRERPHVFAYFGDHQPNLAFPGRRYASTMNRPDYLTQVAVTGNTPTMRTMPPFMTSNLLPGLLIECAGLPPDTFFKANITARRRFQGKLEDHENQAEIADYLAYIHQESPPRPNVPTLCSAGAE